MYARPAALAWGAEPQCCHYPKIMFIATEWPIFLKPFLLMAKPEDRGLGDILARAIGPMGGDAFKKWHREFTGHDCKCELRQEGLNLQFPLPVAKNQPPRLPCPKSPDFSAKK
jgi:hypothetical protein